MARKTGSHAEITGPRIREAALGLFAERGYAAVSMRQIAAEVGVQAGALYLYTANKQALLFDLLRDHMTDLLAGYDIAAQPGRATERLRRFTQFHILYHMDRPHLVFVSYMELRNLEPKNFAEIERLRHAYEDRLEAILIAGQRSGEFALTDTRLATLALIAMLTGVNTWYREGGRLSRERIGEVYWQMVRKTVSASAGPGLRHGA